MNTNPFSLPAPMPPAEMPIPTFTQALPKAKEYMLSLISPSLLKLGTADVDLRGFHPQVVANVVDTLRDKDWDCKFMTIEVDAPMPYPGVPKVKIQILRVTKEVNVLDNLPVKA